MVHDPLRPLAASSESQVVAVLLALRALVATEHVVAQVAGGMTELVVDA